MQKNRKIEELKQREKVLDYSHEIKENQEEEPFVLELYKSNDFTIFQHFTPPHLSVFSALKTLDELLKQDNQREKDGFLKRIRLGKILKPLPGDKTKIVIVPSTYEPKFYHDNSITEEEHNKDTGGSGKEQEGEIIGRQKVDPHQGEGEGQGAGKGKSSKHELGANAFDLGKILTEQFQLPNLKNKGQKRSLSKYTYELTDRNKGFGQLLDKKETLRNIIKTNILLGNISGQEPFEPKDLILNPKDKIYRIFSKERDFEAQAAVFFIRDYSGSMSGKPTEAITTQHLLIYSWLMYQYKNNVLTKFIVHDTEAKEVPDFYSYYKFQVAGGTNVFPAFELANKIIEREQLAKDYNIYLFYGTDGDDWESSGEKMLKALNITLEYSNRTGITIAKNGWTNGQTIVEKYIEKSGLLKSKSDLLKMDSFDSEGFTQDKLIESIRKLIED